MCSILWTNVSYAFLQGWVHVGVGVSDRFPCKCVTCSTARASWRSVCALIFSLCARVHVRMCAWEREVYISGLCARLWSSLCVSDIGLRTNICTLLGRKGDSGVRWGSHSSHQRCQTVSHASGQNHSAHTLFWVCVCVSVWGVFYVKQMIYVISRCFFSGQVGRRSDRSLMTVAWCYMHTQAHCASWQVPDVLISAGPSTSCVGSGQ